MWRNFIFLLFFLLAKITVAQVGVNPRLAPEITLPNLNADVEFYDQSTGVIRKVKLGTLAKYFEPKVNPTPLGYLPTTTGNTQNLGSISKDPNGNLWYIANNGDAILLVSNSSLLPNEQNTLPLNNIASIPITIPIPNNLNRFKAEREGLGMVLGRDYIISGSNLILIQPAINERFRFWTF
jgi:hypothetical protein